MFCFTVRPLTFSLKELGIQISSEGQSVHQCFSQFSRSACFFCHSLCLAHTHSTRRAPSHMVWPLYSTSLCPCHYNGKSWHSVVPVEKRQEHLSTDDKGLCGRLLFIEEGERTLNVFYNFFFFWLNLNKFVPSSDLSVLDLFFSRVEFCVLVRLWQAFSKVRTPEDCQWITACSVNTITLRTCTTLCFPITEHWQSLATASLSALLAQEATKSHHYLDYITRPPTHAACPRYSKCISGLLLTPASGLVPCLGHYQGVQV